MSSRPRIWSSTVVSTVSGSPTNPRSTILSILDPDRSMRAARLARKHHVAVLAAQADRLAAGRVDEADDLLVDRAREHHLDDLDGGGIGDAQPAGELRLDAEPLEHLADLRPAAVHHHRIDARSAPSARCRGRSFARAPPRPWRGRRISPPRSPRRSAACGAALPSRTWAMSCGRQGHSENSVRRHCARLDLAIASS